MTPTAPPLRIKKLEESVINRIAAGEVIQRPSSAIKELIENSIDAHATFIQVAVKGGGLTMLQVTDNGCGIHYEDLELLCKRFATSKLKTFEDLKTIGTFGFRGEALASITHVARVSITTQPHGQAFGYRAGYLDGNLKEKPTKCASVGGTTIVAEDLFYNVPQRLQAFNANEEYNRILEMVQRYSIHNRGVGFTCKRLGGNNNNTLDLSTDKDSTILENIRTVFGVETSRELLELNCNYEKEEGEEKKQFSIRGYVSGGNYSRKRSEFILFINNRLVDSSTLKRAVESVYLDFLPKNTHPFVYLAIELPPQTVDVNVHPTKREVQFLFENEIIHELIQGIKRVLKGANSSRTFYSSSSSQQQQQLPYFSQSTDYDEPAALENNNNNNNNNEEEEGEGEEEEDEKKENEENDNDHPQNRSSSIKKKKRYDSKLVRTSPLTGNIEAFLQVNTSNNNIINLDVVEEEEEKKKQCCDDDHNDDEGEQQPQPPLLPPPSNNNNNNNTTNEDLEKAPLILKDSDALRLQSVIEIKQEMNETAVSDLVDLIRKAVFVGCLDANSMLLQSGTGLIAVNLGNAAKEMFRQRVFTLFGRFLPIDINPPIPLKEILPNHVEYDLLISKKDILYEYFGINMLPGGEGHYFLHAIPRLVARHIPLPIAIPKLIQSLASSSVIWTDEKKCFLSIAACIANAYSILPPFLPLLDPGSSSSNNNNLYDRENFHFLVKNVIFPAIRSFFLPHRAFLQQVQLPNGNNNFFVKVAQLDQLYKVFERC